MGKKFGVSFSFSRAIGLSGLKNKISRQTGIPMTKIGFNNKIGRNIVNYFTGKPKT